VETRTDERRTVVKTWLGAGVGMEGSYLAGTVALATSLLRGVAPRAEMVAHGKIGTAFGPTLKSCDQKQN